MKQSGLIMIVLFLAGTLFSLSIGNWQNLRLSGPTADGSVLVRTEHPAAAVSTHNLHYYNGSSIISQTFSPHSAPTNTLQASYTPVGTNTNLGLSSTLPSGIKEVNPVFWASESLPQLGQITPVSTDPANDQSTNYLDIVADYFSFSDSKFFAAIQNRGGGFPTSGSFGTRYFSYMAVMANPADDPNDPDTIVWAMVYMNVALGGITPGLYKITGTSTSDLIRIGNIQQQIVSGSNYLVMSCNISDLMADADFAAWYNPANPTLGFVSLTSLTTVIPFATTETDVSGGGIIYPTRFQNAAGNDASFTMGNFQVQINEEELYFSADFADPAFGRFPYSVQAEILGGESFELLEQSLDYSQPVTFKSTNLWGIIGEYDEASLRAKALVFHPSANYSDELVFSYVYGMSSPQELELVVSGVEAILSWQPVSQSLLGNPIPADSYRIEYDTDPAFSNPQWSAETTATFINVPLGLDKKFFRVTAIKEIP